MHDDSRRAAALIRDRIGSDFIEVGLIANAGVAGIAEHVMSPHALDYGELPGFPVSSGGTQPCRCVVGGLGSVRVAVLQGRAHYHERGDVQCMRVPLETLALLGANAVVLTGAVGSLRKEIMPGAFVAVRDHINLTGINPLIGDGSEKRSVDLTSAYDAHLRQRFALVTGEAGRKTSEGTLMWFPGPHFETPAEIAAARLLGADLVGMSIVPETIIARQLGLRVLALTTVTNFAAGLNDETLGRDHSMRVAGAAATSLTRVLVKLFERWVIDTRR